MDVRPGPMDDPCDDHPTPHDRARAPMRGSAAVGASRSTGRGPTSRRRPGPASPGPRARRRVFGCKRVDSVTRPSNMRRSTRVGLTPLCCAPYCPEDTFRRIVGRDAHRRLGKRYDPDERLPGLHDACVRGRERVDAGQRCPGRPSAVRPRCAAGHPCCATTRSGSSMRSAPKASRKAGRSGWRSRRYGGGNPGSDPDVRSRSLRHR